MFFKALSLQIKEADYTEDLLYAADKYHLLGLVSHPLFIRPFDYIQIKKKSKFDSITSKIKGEAVRAPLQR